MLWRLAMFAVLATACGSQEPALSHDELFDPAACKDCHERHYTEWIGSSHAYAADDPVFAAMNARFLRDTGGDPATCVRCHAPVALAEGATTDGSNLATVDPALKGVTCFACHVVATANPASHEFELATDDVLLGPIDNPVGTGAHHSAYSTLVDRDVWRSTDLCGTCHDFQNTNGVHVHRTYTEWTDSMFSDSFNQLFLSCGGCHMDSDPAKIATGNVPVRRHHNHTLPGMNVALQPWPEANTQRDAINEDLAPVVFARLCLSGGVLQPIVTLDNVMGGHAFPSGDTSTRRAWVELTVYSGTRVIYQSGVVDDDTPLLSKTDPDLWLLGDKLIDDSGAYALFPWQAATLDATGLQPAVTNDPADPRYYHSVTREYPALTEVPDRMTLRVRVRPIGLDVIDELIAGGDLDTAVRARIPTFTLEGTMIEWTGERGDCVPAL